jgi:hypothetical protein
MTNGHPHFKIILAITALALAALACAAPTRSDNNKAPVLTAQLRDVEGSVRIRPSTDSDFITADDGQVLGLNGQVLTQDNGQAHIDLATGTSIHLAPLSVLTLHEVGTRDIAIPGKLRLDLGQIWLLMEAGAITVDTPAGVVSGEVAHMGIAVNLTGDVTITCLLGKCNYQNESGEVQLVAGQWAILSGPDQAPESGTMAEADINAWIAANPTAEAVRPALQATQAWLKNPHVKLPELACLADNTCAAFCAPAGWTPTSAEDPDPAAMPEACIQAAQSLADQYVDADKFLVCLVLTNSPQQCADDAKAK